MNINEFENILLKLKLKYEKEEYLFGYITLDIYTIPSKENKNFNDSLTIDAIRKTFDEELPGSEQALRVTYHITNEDYILFNCRCHDGREQVLMEHCYLMNYEFNIQNYIKFLETSCINHY